MSAVSAHPRLGALIQRELDLSRAEHPLSLELAERARASLLAGVPMHWLTS